MIQTKLSLSYLTVKYNLSPKLIKSISEATKTKVDEVKNDASSLDTVSYLTTPVNSHLKIYSNKVKFEGQPATEISHEPPPRGKIQEFSANSRRRMLQMLSEIDLNHYNHVFFVTVTFHEIYPTEKNELKKILDNYLKKLKFQDSSISYVWRLELQLRGAPHFHFVFLFENKLSKSKTKKFVSLFRRGWCEEVYKLDTKQFNKQVKIVEVTKKQYVFRYISKYTAKSEEHPISIGIGRRWGYSQNLYRCPIFDVKIKGSLEVIFRRNLLNWCHQNFNPSSWFDFALEVSDNFSVLIDQSIIRELLSESLKEHFNKFSNLGYETDLSPGFAPWCFNPNLSLD